MPCSTVALTSRPRLALVVSLLTTETRLSDAEATKPGVFPAINAVLFPRPLLLLRVQQRHHEKSGKCALRFLSH
jgi:hypothetical protein